MAHLTKLKVVLLAAVGAGCIEEHEDTKDADLRSDAAILDATTGTDAGRAPSSTCDTPMPVLAQGDTPTGVVQCADGSRERTRAEQCLPSVGELLGCPERQEGCQAHADCGDTALDFCLSGFDFCYCAQACETDADCAADQACLCAGSMGNGAEISRCVPADCRTNADCASGSCGVSTEDTGCGLQYALACRAPEQDRCRANSDCTPGDYCQAVEEGYECRGPDAVCGRPLRVAGTPRTCDTVARDDWLETHSPHLDGLTVDERRRLADFWAGIGALEHASVAGFARFSLQLMAVGAPADLLAEAQTAALDEVRHAQLAYSLASAYAGKTLGPGATQLDDFSLETHPDVIAAEVALEACVGETLGASEAAEAAAQCEDPVVRAIWQRIAEDEARHAALGWKTLTWLLREGTDATREAVRKAFDAAKNERFAGEGTDGLPTHGYCSGAARHAVHQQTWDEVIAPCIAALRLA